MEKLSYLSFDPAWGSGEMPPVPEIPLYELIRRSAARHGDKTALVSLGREITYAAMDRLSDRLAHYLALEGVKRGDRVATLLPNCAQHVIAFHGIIKAGAVSVPCNVMLKGEELAYILNDAQAETVVCLDLLYPLVQSVTGGTPVRRVITVHIKDFYAGDAWVPPLLDREKLTFPGAVDLMEILHGCPPEPPEPEMNPRKDLALLLYTAGTTGAAKGVMETHYNLVYNCLSHSHLMDFDADDVNLQIMPMFHTSGYFLGLHPFLYRGGTVVLMPMFDPEELLKIIDRYRVNTLFAPPTLFVALVNHPKLSRYGLGHFKLATGCGAPVPAALQKRWKELTGVDLTNGWGMTETNCGGIMSLPHKKNLASLGVPVAGEVKVIDPEGNTVPRGEVGEICFRGPQVALGYWNKPEETGRAFDAEGWLHTGDAGYMDGEGFTYFVDRIKDLIIASGYNIAPFEVESALMKHPAVAEAAVIGVPHAYRGETVKAFIALRKEYRGEVTVEDISRYCEENMATYKRPRIIEFVDDLPKNAVGKVLRRKLKEMEREKIQADTVSNERTMLIHKFLENAVGNFPDKPYLFYGGRQITFRELDALSDKLACSFLKMGLGRGDKIAIVAPNQPEWLYTYFAAVKIGAAVVALNVRYRLAEFEYMLNNSESKALVYVGEFGGFNFSAFFAENRPRFPTVQKYICIGGGLSGEIAFAGLTTGALPDKDRLDSVRAKVAQSDTAIIIYTSGTTGKPKGAMITNRSILASAMAEVDHFALTEEDVFIANLPLNHVGGITCTVTTSLIKGGSVVLIPGFRPDLVLEAMEEFRVTVFGGVPTMYVMMLSLPDFAKYDLSAVRICIAGGSSVEARLCADITRAFPRARLLNLYGLSETSGACVLSLPDDPPEKVGESIGMVIGDFRVRVVGEGGSDLPAGEIGELAFKGDCVAAGYYGLQEETDEAFKDGWVFTGDMGYVDQEGYIYLRGRKKEMYIQGGFNVYPAEVENILTRHPKVLVAAGIGVPDPVFGEVGRFYVIPGPGAVLTEEEIIAYCKEKMADYKVPRQIEFVTELPLTPAGKVHKALLKERFLNKRVN